MRVNVQGNDRPSGQGQLLRTGTADGPDVDISIFTAANHVLDECEKEGEEERGSVC